MPFELPAPLVRYRAILKEGMPPAYVHCRQCSGGVKSSTLAGAEDVELREAHRDAAAGLREFREDLLENPLKKRHPGVPEEGEASLLDVKRELARRMLSSCRLCERRCGADRAGGEKGWCGVGGMESMRVSSIFTHMGEEPELVPSLTVFFSGCTLDCAFCQNWDISRHPEDGAPMPPRRLASKIDGFTGEKHGPINLNWVGGDPTPAIPLILEVMALLETPVPQVFNSNMYLSAEGMELLDGVIDLYLADMKFGSDECARRLCGVERYTEVVVGNHVAAAQGADLLVRHLILPEHLECCTYPVIQTLEERIGHDRVRLNIMDQYRPAHRASEHPDIDRHLSVGDLGKAVRYAERLGFGRPY